MLTVLIAIGAFIFGVLFGWNNGKASLIKKLPANLQDAVNSALKK